MKCIYSRNENPNYLTICFTNTKPKYVAYLETGRFQEKVRIILLIKKSVPSKSSKAIQKFKSRHCQNAVRAAQKSDFCAAHALV